MNRVCDNVLLDEGWLLVFDNVENAKDLNKYWLHCGHGAVIITTQVPEICYRTSSKIALEPFSDEDGSAMYLNKEGTSKAIQQAEAISKEVDGLPLLLVGLAGYIGQSRLSFQEILRILRDKREHTRRLLTNGSTTSINFQYERPIQMVYDFALQGLPQLARDVLNILSMLSPDKVLEKLLFSDSRRAHLPLIPNLERQQ